MRRPAGRLGACLAACLIGLPVQAQESVLRTRYLCDGRAEVEAIYINDSDPQRVALLVEGKLVLLEQGRAASGVRYEAGSGGPAYQWWTKGDEASLSWLGEGGPRPVYETCIEE
ncbi:MliC family protein [Pseudoroseicyclus aestuarii]|uniref:Membrane-bound inhibitor of C-type lysozyme n=1 Tax=Pseudoroseicyclus aestuarii TaxID=1795041 RepID=A0A318SNT9_9RHOB|nr:MliC family protein [Pseudoroseicyclus aestuarii]PYE81245.1 membrane-bound inhibitor of C-type lysozyme [Pseudoroseicyclus aestuarii]